MPRKSKPFIDKKNSTTYHIVHRSQRDIENENASSTILIPTDPPPTSDKMSSLHTTLEQAGLTPDYNYSQHLQPITGSGIYYSTKGGSSNPNVDPRSKKVMISDDIKEVSRQLESITLNQECMEEDIADALFNFEECDFEEILDDFCVEAAKSPEVGSDAEQDDAEFDFDEHIRKLMERAEKKESAAKVSTKVTAKDDFFRGMTPLHRKKNETSLEVKFVVPTTPEEKLALEQKFEETLLEYDSDQVGDLDEECEEIGGFRELEGDKQLEAALDDFLINEKDKYFMEINKKKEGLVGTDLIVPKRLSHLRPDVDDQDEEKVEEVLKEADRILANPEMEPPEEDVLIDGKSYFSERERNPWDCESILTTYSNLDNHPTTIDRTKTKKKKKRPQQPQQPQPVQIELSKKTGLPIGVLPTKEKMAKDPNPINLGESRKKNESKEEKKARKQALKEQRQEARMQKKIMKSAFQDEFLKRNVEVVVDDVGGKSVFRYS